MIFRPRTPTGTSDTTLSALSFLRHPKNWLIPSVVLTAAIFAITVVFTGSAANPAADLHHAPIGLVNLDQGAATPAMNLGAQVAAGIESQPQKPAEAVSWRRFDSLESVTDAIADNELFAAVVIPSDYTPKLLSLLTSTPQRPEVTVLTNHGAGTMAAELGAQIAEGAARGGSVAAAGQLLAHTTDNLAPANAVLLADPVTLTAHQAVPFGNRTGNGMTAFFFALLLMMVGFLGANVINGLVDSELGFGATEIGPKRRMLPPRHINRLHTFSAKCLTLFIASIPAATAILAAAAFAVDLDLPNCGLLWLFSILAINAIGVGTLAVVTLLGPIGIVISMIFFIGWSIPVSGGAIPQQALPPFWRFLGSFEPMRGVCDGVRAIIYFDAHADAGLSRALLLLVAGLVAGLVLGLLGNTVYDRMGMHRIHPRAIPRIQEFLQNVPHHRDPAPSAAESVGDRRGAHRH
ncbi:YhgE/Pip domain-containing protein [Nocardia fluminea]|uniref:YhgE/Pip domain-containing protein n=1 Tax=Nocardia fluminea TaxID=134984 RepID=UPI0036525D02